jgi:EAL domain-containing protein (putative c-di-GMP-specific phosphodiesterase class I)
VTHLRELAAATERLRMIGYGLAIDDVGPAIRDHSALLDLPFTMLKLDKQVVQEAPISKASAEFLAKAVDAAKRARLTTVAEGVEDAATWTYMRAAGVDLAQGFLVSYPIAAADVATWHSAW